MLSCNCGEGFMKFHSSGFKRKYVDDLSCAILALVKLGTRQLNKVCSKSMEMLLSWC